MPEFTLPEALTRLLQAGIGPSVNGPSIVQQDLHPIVSRERVRRIAAGERRICLYPPPFGTIAETRAVEGAGGFLEKFGALDQIDPERTLIIGDFGIGADSLIVLDYSCNPSNPPVLRLRWGSFGKGNSWVVSARDFDEFAEVLGLR